jgi:DNA invertase Pin-like site-specific DNA recombinase
MRKAAVYLRASTEHGSAADQEQALREVANRLGCEIVKVYRDDESTGAKRPQLEKLRSDASNRKFDVVMVCSPDRLARSLKELVGFLSEIHDLKIDLYLHKQGIDTAASSGKAIFEMTDFFAEFERAVVRNNLRDGWEKAKRNGKLRGKRRIEPQVENAIRDALRKGDSGILRIAKRFGVGTGTVQKIKAEMAALTAEPATHQSFPSSSASPSKK